MSSSVESERLSPLIGWALCWLAAVSLAGYVWAHPYGECDTWQEDAAAVVYLLITAGTLGFSLAAMRVHKWWFLVIPLVLISLFAFASAVVYVRFVFVVDCAVAQ